MYSVLYVDDEPGLLEIGKMFLEATEGFAVDTLTSASDALTVIQQKKYDAVISDYQMPGMDGIEFLKAVRASGNTIPFILFTGRGREEVVIEAINAGADFYLQKGGDPTAQFAELVLKIRQSVKRRRTEEALSESERRFRELADLLPQGIYEAGIDGTMTYVNRHALEMFGYTDEDIRNGLNAITTIAPDDRPKATRAFRTMADKGSIPKTSVEYLALRKDGSTFNVAIFSSPVLRNGRIVGIRGILMDITERKQIEDELRAAHEQLVASDEELQSQFEALAQGEQRIRESEEKYRGMAERSSDLILVIDKGMSVSYASPSCRSILGYEPEELVGKTREFGAATIFSPSLSEFTAPLQAGMKGLPVEIREIQINKKDGSAAWVEMYAVPVMRDGVFDGAQVSMRDITERKRVADEKIRFGRIIDDSINEIYTFDAETLRFLDVNRGACENLGYSLDELRAFTLLDIKSNLTRESFEKRVAPLRGGEAEKIVFSTEQKRKDGTLYPVEVHLHLSRTGTRPVFIAIILDITDRRKAEEAHRESEAFFQGLFSQSTQLTGVLDLQGRLIRANAAAMAFIDTDLEQVIGQPFWETPWWSNDPETQAAMKDAISRAGRGENVHFDAIHKDTEGNVHFIDFFLKPVVDDKGNIIAFLPEGRDITRQKETEVALRESEEKYRSLVETSFDGIIIHQDGLIVYANSTAGKLMGAGPLNEVIGKPILSFVHPDFRTVVYQRMNAATAETQSVIREKFLRLDGSSIDVDVVAIPFVWKDKPAVHVVFRDITRQKETDEALRRSEEKFRSFVENANEIVFSLTPDGIFTYVSPKWTELLGHDMSEVIGKPAAAIIHPDDVPRINEFIQRTIMTGNKASGIEYRVQHKNGTWQWHTQSISPVYDVGGRVIAVQGICHDITEHKRVRDNLRRANRQLSLLTGVTRHDILNNVSTARGYLKIAEMKYGDPAQAEYMKKTDDAITEIKSQIEFTKVYQDLGAHDPQWIDLDMVMPRAHVPKTISLNADVRGVMVLADPMLEKVFFNLLDNSLRHGERVTEIAVSSHQSDGNLVIVWEDNGIGVASDEKERIFERGFGKNTGMGLFLVREILSITGISITENGEPGKGARFEIVIPNGAYRFPD